MIAQCETYSTHDAAITLTVASRVVTDRLAEIGTDQATVTRIRNKLLAIVAEIDDLTIKPVFRVVR